MAIVRKMTPLTLERDTKHQEVDCTFCVVTGSDGQKSLQIDTYGSSLRQMPGKKSQSLRFSPEAIEQLRSILDSLP